MKVAGLQPDVITYNAMISTCEKAKNLEAAERERMEEEIRVKQEEIERVREEVEEKERRAQELQVRLSLRCQKGISYLLCRKRLKFLVRSTRSLS